MARTSPIPRKANRLTAGANRSAAAGRQSEAMRMAGKSVPSRWPLTSKNELMTMTSAQAMPADRTVLARERRAWKPKAINMHTATSTANTLSRPPSLANQSQLDSGCTGRRSKKGS